MSGCYIREGGVIEEDLSLDSNATPVSVDSPCGAAIEAAISNAPAPADNVVVEGN